MSTSTIFSEHRGFESAHFSRPDSHQGKINNSPGSSQAGCHGTRWARARARHTALHATTLRRNSSNSSVLSTVIVLEITLTHCNALNTGFTVKRQRDGSLEKFKARLVADGNTQKYGVDFDRIFSTVVKSTTIRIVLILACSRGWLLSGVDIAQAYLHAELSEDLYMMMPPLPTMYQGFALVLCLIPNFFPFANQTLSIARNNPPDGEQIEYGFLNEEPRLQFFNVSSLENFPRVLNAGPTSTLGSDEHLDDLLRTSRVRIRPFFASVLRYTVVEPFATFGTVLPHAPSPGGRGQGGRKGGGRGGRGAGGKGRGTGTTLNPCLRCLLTNHTRPQCNKQTVQCQYCGADHHPTICFHASAPGGARRDSLSPGAAALVKRECGVSTHSTALSTVANSTATQNTARANHATMSEMGDGTESQAASNAGTSQLTHSIAAQSAAVTQWPPAGQPGVGIWMVHLPNLATDALAAFATRAAPSAGTAIPGRLPDYTKRASAYVDSMATLFVVNSVRFLRWVTDASPQYSADTIGGPVPIDAVGIAEIWIPFINGNTKRTHWRMHTVHNVLVCSSSPVECLYSTRVMERVFGYQHLFGKDCYISAPEIVNSYCTFEDDGSTYTLRCAFSVCDRPELPRKHTSAALAAVVSDAEASTGPMVLPPPILPFDASYTPSAHTATITTGTPQTLLWQRLGFPYAATWRYVQPMLSNSGLPPNAQLSSTLVAHDAVMRGRARALPFFANKPDDKSLPPPGAVLFLDFAGMMIPSRVHRFRCYLGILDKGSNWRRLFPGHTMTSQLAAMSMDLFLAELSSMMGLSHPLKPHKIVTDQGSAFMAVHFLDFLASGQRWHRPAATYTPQQNHAIERIWGTTFGYTRTLLIAARLPANMHPWAVQCATWILNRLPQPSRNNCSPYWLLTRTPADIRFLRVFGCLCRITIPPARRDGDAHFAERGTPGLYLGPSEISSAAVVWDLARTLVLHAGPHVRHPMPPWHHLTSATPP